MSTNKMVCAVAIALGAFATLSCKNKKNGLNRPSLSTTPIGAPQNPGSGAKIIPPTPVIGSFLVELRRNDGEPMANAKVGMLGKESEVAGPSALNSLLFSLGTGSAQVIHDTNADQFGLVALPINKISSSQLDLRIEDAGRAFLARFMLPSDFASAVSQVRVNGGLPPLPDYPAEPQEVGGIPTSSDSLLTARKVALQLPENRVADVPGGDPNNVSEEQVYLEPVALPVTIDSLDKTFDIFGGVNNVSVAAAARFGWNNSFMSNADVRIAFSFSEASLSGWDGQISLVPNLSVSKDGINFVTDFTACTDPSFRTQVTGPLKAVDNGQCGFLRSEFPFNQGVDVFVRVAGESETTIKMSPVFRILVSNTAPTLSSISDRSVLINTSAIEIPITLTDAESQLVCGAAISAKSANEILLPNRNIFVGGKFPDCRILLYPMQNVSGISIVSVLATDGSLTAQSDFTLEVTGASSGILLSSVSPADGSTIGNNATLLGACGEDLTLGVSGDDLLGSPFTTTCTSGGTFSVPLSFAGTDGNKTITIRETTVTGQQRQTTRMFVRDATPPQVDIGNLSFEQIKNGSEANFAITFSDASGVGVVDNVVVTITPALGVSCSSRVAGSGVGPFAVTLSSCIGDGTVTIMVTTGTAADIVGNSSPAITANRTLTIDNTPPSVAVSAPSSAYVTQSSSATFSVIFSDTNSMTADESSITLQQTGTASCTKSISGFGTVASPFVVTVSSCSGDGNVGVNVGTGGARDSAGNDSALASSSQTLIVVNSPLSFTPANPTILSGEPFTVSATNSTPPPFASYALSNGGTFSLLTSLFSSLAGSQPFKTILSLIDSGFRAGETEISVKGFVQKNNISIPLQAYGGGTAFGIVFFNGAYYAGATLENGLFYDGEAVHRISPTGTEIELVDNYQRYGEIHSMSLISTGSALLHCSYEWEVGFRGSQWTVRRSVDGINWMTTDRHGTLLAFGAPGTVYDHVCYDIASSPTTAGRVFAVGEDEEQVMGATLRESSDDGVTWNTSASFNDSTGAISVDVASDESVWIITTTSWFNGTYKLRKGTKSGSNWTWNDAQIGDPGQSCGSLYEHYGDLRIIDSTTAVFSGCFSSKWLIKRTSDGGQTWVTVYTDPQLVGGGGTIAKLSNGSLIATGRSGTGGSFTAKILRSTDNGLTWTSLYENSLDQFETTAVAAGAGTEVMVLATGKNFDIHVLRSSDSGGTWALTNKYKLKQDFSQITGVVSDSAGSLWAWSDWVPEIEIGEREPWLLLKSQDRGATWQTSLEKNALFNQNVKKIATNPDGSVYALGSFNNENVIRKSSDGGLSWTKIMVIDNSVSYWNLDIFSGKDDTIYLTSDLGAKAGKSGGALWNDIVAITPPDGTFVSRGYFPLNDGSLLNIGFIDLTTSTSADLVIYRSNDHGSSWNEWYRQINFVPDANVASLSARAFATQDSSGKFYLLANYGSALSERFLKSTVDMGNTWNNEVLPNIVVDDLLTDSTGKLYAVAGAAEIYARSTQTNQWFLVSDESTNPNDIYEQDYSPVVTRCLETICVFGGFSQVGLGNRKILRMLEMPP